ncbi:unnamed protein product, partial [Prorocentrum cordatum]
ASGVCGGGGACRGTGVTSLADVYIPMPFPVLDDATLQLERLVEDTHRALLRDGLIGRADGPAGDPGGALALPSLDAVDRALEELQSGLREIDDALAGN